MSIVVIGSVAFDTLTTPFGKACNVLGGSATYFSLSASYFTHIHLVACVGMDFSKQYQLLFKKHNIDISEMEYVQGKTFSWIGEYRDDLSSPRTIATQLNVFSSFNPTLASRTCNARYVFLGNIHPALQYKVWKQFKAPTIVACDSMNLWIEKERRALLNVLKQVDIFFLNESEARLLTEETGMLKAARTLRSWGPKMVIIKKGEHGALLFADGWYFSVPAFLVDIPKDPTGAGDSFAGGFMGYLAKKESFKKEDLCKAMFYGTIMSSYTVEDFSVRRLSMLTKKDILYRFEALRQITHFK